jgi:uncharacterized protein DUF3617
MKKAIVALAIPALVDASAVAGREEPELLRAGEYQVTVRVELPHIEDTGVAAKVVSICVVASDVGRHGLPALSHLNPLRKCAASNVLLNGSALSFDIVCPGNDAAVGSAKYTMQADRFDGAIAVKMGGKNMTMIERQSGRRVGNCK